MKKPNLFRSTLIITVIIIIGSTLLSLFSFLSFYYMDNVQFSYNNGNLESWFIRDTSSVNTVKINDSLPHYQYKILMDSITDMDNKKEAQKNNIGSGIMGNIIGYTEFRECDTCQESEKKKTLKFRNKFKPLRDSMNQILSKKQHPTSQDSALTDSLSFNYYVKGTSNARLNQPEKYFLYFAGYSLNNDCTYLIDSGNYKLKYPVWDIMDAGKKRLKEHTGYLAIKQIPFRFVEKKNAILLPINALNFKIAKTVILVFYISILIYSIIIMIILPIIILLSISKGIVFTLNNIKYLYFIAYSFLGYSLFSCILTVALRFVFQLYKVSEFSYNYWNLAEDYYISFLIGLIVYGIAKAFDKGYQIQKENDLIV